MPHKDPVDRLEYQRRYREKNRKEIQRRKRQWFKERWDASEKFRSKYASRRLSKAAHAAHQRVHKAIQRGEISRPDGCSQCGAEGFIEAAHENYTERLAIRWLCRTCHRRWDRTTGKKAFEEPSTPVNFNQPRKLLDFICPVCAKAFQATYHDSLRYTDKRCCSRSCGMKQSRAIRRTRGP